MSSDPTTNGGGPQVDGKSFDSVEYLLFDSLVHHLIEKGVLTKNDALSVVKTAAEVVRGRMHELGTDNADPHGAISSLERTYASFEALPNRYGRPGLDGHNVHTLRPPLHGERPRFPSEDD